MVGYAARGNTAYTSLSLTSSDIWFALPVTIGTQLQLGIWASIIAGEGSAGGSLGLDTAAANLSDTISWGGPGYLMEGGNTITNFSISSTSGFNYNQAASVGTPEPATILLAGLALAAMTYCGLCRSAQAR